MNRGIQRALWTAAAIHLLIGGASFATIYGGGGAASTDCLAVFDATVNYPATRPTQVRCVDGDPACDADGVVNGVCQIPVGVCVNSRFDARCTLAGVQSVTVAHAVDDGKDAKFQPDFQALQSEIDGDIPLPTAAFDACTSAPVNIQVPIRGPTGAVGKHRCMANTKILMLKTVAPPVGRRSSIDADMIRLTCVPSPNSGCDPRTLFPTGTFERIQKQVFNQTCATSTCHDSQTHQNGLLLENGASLANLINIDPTNVSAFNAGWKRVHVLSSTTGDPTTSYLYRKLTAPLPDLSYGARMPKMRPALDPNLRDAIRLWILNGAPDTGWIAGTD